MMRDPYTVLGVDRSASEKEIKSAFRKMAKQFHPDQNPNNPKAKERFAEVNTAYEIIGDKVKRGQFDRGEIDNEGKEKFAGFAGGGNPFAGMHRQGEGNPFGGGMGGAEDILKEMFGSAFGGARSSAFGGGQQTRQRAKAPDIKLKAVARAEDLTRGKTEILFPDGRKVAVSIPAEATDGQVIRLKGQGHKQAGAEPGDALVTLVFRNDGKYEIRGTDLRTDVDLPLELAVKGGKLTVDTLDGKISLGIPAWTTSGKTFRLKGKGLPKKDKSMGDLLVRVMIALPDQEIAGLKDLFANQS